MADTSIRNDFIEGVQEIFSTLFNDGIDDGIDLYLLSKRTESSSVYNEQKEKIYKKPVRLVCSAQLTPEEGENVEEYKSRAIFKVPLKSLQDNNIPIDLDTLNKSLIKFKEVFYTVTVVKPATYVEDVFLLYSFECVESATIMGVRIEPERIGMK